MRRLTCWLALLCVGLLPLGCGGGSDTPAPPGPGTGPDATAPQITLTAPTHLADALIGIVNVTADASDNVAVAVAGVEFQIDGIAIAAEVTTAPYQTSDSSAAFASGQHVLRARARDAVGNRSPWASATVRFGSLVNSTQGFSRSDNWITGLTSATAFAQTPGGRLLVAQQGGALRVVKNGALLATPFVQLGVDSSGERGLLGVAAHPDFVNNGYIYLYYTSTVGGAHNRISRLVANGDVAVGGETVLVDLPNLSGAANHNGGALHFGGEGKLYLGVGDNADFIKSQNLADPFGKLLRFNDDGTIPSDNPQFR